MKEFDEDIAKRVERLQVKQPFTFSVSGNVCGSDDETESYESE